MEKIKTVDDWGTTDRLGGRALTDGEKLRVRWPDGTVEEVTVVLASQTAPIHEQGHLHATGSWVTRKAYARILYRGAVARVRLAGHYAERV